jgi:hypothetical protein
MKRRIVRIGGLVMVVLVLSAAAASAQDAAGGVAQLRWSTEGAAGVQLQYTGTIQSVAFGFAPTRSLTFLIGAERSRTDDEIEFYPDGYASERGGLVEFVSAELRYAFFANKRVSPLRGGRHRTWCRAPERERVLPARRRPQNRRDLLWRRRAHSNPSTPRRVRGLAIDHHG